MGKVLRTTRLAAILAVGLAAAACSPIYRNHGYVPTDRDLADLSVGIDTRDTVAAAVGRPSAAGLLKESGWYYVQSRWRHYGAFEPREIDRQVVAISFNDGGVITNIERFGLEEGRVVPLSRRVTDSNIAGISFLRQLFGSVGNFTADQLLGDD
ncbi:outer membrane protein assembly factor BamE [Tranquillimonas alkanivorans]|uniref:Beta-barrel assembly machine subunit BamE n=1 Tax=Tranquillimonas alkanivorans TaxID=441119 RepID=A0A1I5NFD2_9RHOB|nr:outer membrane protein assembly factor BamE [Tranquillimonas alkanivorans]SFP20503.1 Beta-barrel assembly machine subunit BamE [Tranquillimonas alkanivorans]